MQDREKTDSNLKLVRRDELGGNEAVHRTVLNYALAVAFVTAAAVLRWTLPQVLERTTFLAFYPAVVAAAMLGGLGPGMMATLGSTVCYALWFDPTPGQVGLDVLDMVRVGIFAVGGMGVSLLARRQRLAYARERRQAQEVREQAGFQQAVMANMGEGLYTLDAQGLVTYLNPAAERFFGWTAGELLGRTMHEMIHYRHPDGTPFPIEQCPGFKVLRQGGILTNHEDVFIRKDGTFFPVVYSSSPLFVEDRIVGLVVVFRDVTAQKQAEAAQREGEERFGAFMRHLPGAAWMKDLQGRYLLANPKAEEIFGRTQQQIQGRTDEEIFPPDTARLFRENDGRALAEGVVEATEVLRQPDGVDHYSIVTKFAVPGLDGQPACIGGVAFDITERQQAEEALRDSEWRYRTLFDAIDEAFCIIEVIFNENEKPVDYRFLDLNPAFVRQTGLIEAKGKTVRELVPLHEDYWFEIYGRIALTGEAARFQNRAAQLRRWYDVYAFRFGQPEQRQVAVLFNDITARKRAEEELQQINRTLEQRVAERTAEAERGAEELRALAGELARTEQRERHRLAQWLHDDLQQLLVATKMQIALTQAAITEPGLRDLLRKASRLIDESIGQSRSLTAELSPPMLYESGLVAGLEQLSRWIEEKHSLHVALEMRADVAPENQEAAVVLFAITRELLFNVVKHAGVKEARVTLTEAEGQIQLTVEDQGEGFDPALIRGGAKGGFGLLNVRERLRSIGGELQVQSAPGQGARITLLAPAGSAQTVLGGQAETGSFESSGVAPEEAPPARDKREPSPTIRVLLADDHKMVREGLAGLLQQEAGIKVVGQASDGDEAVQLARQLKPDVVTMDVTMPRMNGIEATRRIKSELPHVRVIGLSMHGEKEHGAAMYEAGAAAYLNKGGPSDELLMTIRRIVRPENGQSNS